MRNFKSRSSLRWQQFPYNSLRRCKLLYERKQHTQILSVSNFHRGRTSVKRYWRFRWLKMSSRSTRRCNVGTVRTAFVRSTNLPIVATALKNQASRQAVRHLSRSSFGSRAREFSSFVGHSTVTTPIADVTRRDATVTVTRESLVVRRTNGRTDKRINGWTWTEDETRVGERKRGTRSKMALELQISLSRVSLISVIYLFPPRPVARTDPSTHTRLVSRMIAVGTITDTSWPSYNDVACVHRSWYQMT